MNFSRDMLEEKGEESLKKWELSTAEKGKQRRNHRNNILKQMLKWRETSKQIRRMAQEAEEAAASGNRNQRSQESTEQSILEWLRGPVDLNLQDQQASFGPGRSCTNQVTILQVLVEQRSLQKRFG